MNLLVILSRIPHPLDKGDKLRAFNQIKQLAEKHQIILVALNDSNYKPQTISELNKYCKSVHIISFSRFTIVINLLKTIFSKLPFQVGYFYFNSAQKVIDKLIKDEKPDHIFCQLIRTTEYVKKYYNIPKTLDYMDVFSKGMQRRISTDNWWKRPLVSIEYKRLLHYENYIFDFFKHKVIISEQDKALIPNKNKEEIVVIPNGVDFDFFKPIASEKKFDLLFNGNMNYPPNIESVEYLVTKVLPIVWQKMPAVNLIISGTSPNARVLRLKSNLVVVSGWVNDIRTNFAQSKILVAPMQISIGLQNKLLEAMAMKIPCITTSLANNALGAKHNNEIMVADTPILFAEAIVELLNNYKKRSELAENAFEFVSKKYDWKTNTDVLNALFIQ
jgi:sugar transferase (PEP-CTERM/EpsH1 system associated)